MIIRSETKPNEKLNHFIWTREEKEEKEAVVSFLFSKESRAFYSALVFLSRCEAGQSQQHLLSI